MYVCLDRDVGVLFISAAAVGWVHSSKVSSCGNHKCVHGHKCALYSSVVPGWTEIICEPLLCVYSLHSFHSWDKFFEKLVYFPEVNFSLYFSLVWRKPLLGMRTPFKLGPKYLFQCYCIHLAFWIFPTIWFQSLMLYVGEAAFCESRISDGCWTHPCEIWAMQNAFEAFFSEVKGFTAGCSLNDLQ